DVNPLSGLEIEYNEVNITSHASGDTDDSSGIIFGFVDDDFDNNKGWIDIELIEKNHGRK
ncbi:MAG: hypothetical protein MUO43_11980, partial [Desulfobacterales bacterium]|nr:hypothetical protein [Desulfobacterales bacterium]